MIEPGDTVYDRKERPGKVIGVTEGGLLQVQWEWGAAVMRPEEVLTEGQLRRQEKTRLSSEEFANRYENG